MKRISSESVIIIGIVVLVCAVGLFSSFSAGKPTIEYPEVQRPLAESDFLVSDGGLRVINVGEASLDSLKRDFGEGKFFGMSSVYEPPGKDFIAMFPKKQDILWVFQTQDPSFRTRRATGVGSTVEQVVAAYGEDFTRVGIEGDSTRYDMVYGVPSRGTVAFQVNGGRVTKLVVTRDPQARAR
ncbi:MAG: hypothetical protein QHH05_07190 [Syntrophomonadaceae bacterium]|nr:hypothetical protein [Syntrophomonadaceae bacterium]MDH7498210.1 hypothetical protein [Syntrophomonadaceae bacterium]